jgi:hypothetical protein
MDAYRITNVIKNNSDLDWRTHIYEENKKLVAKNPTSVTSYVKALEISKNKANQKGKSTYGKRFNVDSYDEGFYNFMNSLEEIRSGKKGSKAWYGSHEWEVGRWSINEIDRLVQSSFANPETNPNADLIGVPSIASNANDTSDGRMMADIALNTSDGESINTYKLSNTGSWSVDDSMSKGALSQYTPQKIVSTINEQGKVQSMVELVPLQFNSSGTVSNKRSTSGEAIYVPLPSGGHYANYRNAVQTYFDNVSYLEEYGYAPEKEGLSIQERSNIIEAMLQTDRENPNGILPIAEYEFQ